MSFWMLAKSNWSFLKSRISCLMYWWGWWSFIILNNRSCKKDETKRSFIQTIIFQYAISSSSPVTISCFNVRTIRGASCSIRALRVRVRVRVRVRARGLSWTRSCSISSSWTWKSWRASCCCCSSSRGRASSRWPFQSARFRRKPWRPANFLQTRYFICSFKKPQSRDLGWIQR